MNPVFVKRCGKSFSLFLLLHLGMQAYLLSTSGSGGLSVFSYYFTDYGYWWCLWCGSSPRRLSVFSYYFTPKVKPRTYYVRAGVITFSLFLLLRENSLKSILKSCPPPQTLFQSFLITSDKQIKELESQLSRLRPEVVFQSFLITSGKNL